MLNSTRSQMFVLLLLLQRLIATTGSAIHLKPEAQLGYLEGAHPDGADKGESQVDRGPQLLDRIQRVSPEAAYIIDVLNAIGEHDEGSLGHQLGFMSDSSIKTNDAFSSAPSSIKMPSLSGWSSSYNVLEKRTDTNDPLSRHNRELAAKNNRNSSPSVAERSVSLTHDNVLMRHSLDARSYKDKGRYFFFDSFESWLDEFWAGLRRDTVVNVGKVGGIVLLYYIAPDFLRWLDENVGLE